MYIRKLLRVYLCLQAVLLLLILAALCVDVAAERTRFIAEGSPVSAQRETPLLSAVQRTDLLSGGRALSTLAEYADALPAPFGCLAGVVRSVLTWYAQTAA